MIVMAMMIVIIMIIIIKEGYVTDVAISNSHNFHITTTDKLQTCTDLKEGFRRIWKMKRPVLYQ